MALYLACDVETSDLPRGEQMPFLLSIAAELFDETGTARDFFHTRIRSEGQPINPEAQAVHGISTREAARNGVSEVTALGMLVGFASQARYLVGHNIEFDRDVIVAALARLGRDARLLLRPGLELVCTMRAATPLCRLPSGRSDGAFKWPTLDQLLTFLNLLPRPEPHTAWSDMQAAKACFLELRRRNVIEAAA